MWRFAVYTHKTSSLSATCLKHVRLALKHTDGRADYFRFLSNDAAQATSSMRMEKDQPIREVFSLDDFGLLSVNRSQSVESMSSAGSEHTFLEQLFRNDTLNTFSNVQIPTTMSSKELGGSNEVFGYDYVSELLSEGALAEELAENLLEEETTDSYHDDQEPSTSGLEVTALPFLIPNLELEAKKETRTVLSEKMRRERKLNLSTMPPPSVEHSDHDEHLFHAPGTSQIQNIGEMMFPESLPLGNFSSEWNGAAPTSIANTEAVEEVELAPEISTEFSLEILEGIIADGTMEELKRELDNVGIWPEYLFTGEKSFHARTGWILRFVVENSNDFTEAEKIIRNFVSSHMLAVVPDDVLLHLVTKGITETSTVPSTSADLEKWSSVPMSREIRPNRALVESRLLTLYQSALQKSMTTSQTVLAACMKLNYDHSADIFMKCFTESQLSAEKKNFAKDFNEWKKLATQFGCQEGIDQYWTEAMQSEKDVAKKVSMLLAHCGKIEHPFATMARMICSLIKLNQLEKSLEVFQLVSVSGKHFRGHLASMVEQKDLASIERLSVLVERGMIAERRRGGKRAAAGDRGDKSGEESEKTTLLGKDVHDSLAKFCGVAASGKKKKFVDKKLKKKIHRVDEEQLHELCKAIQKAWISCSDSNESTNRLVEWCQKNRIEIDEKVQKKINSKLQSSS